jgi:hypothetical protein
VKTITIKAGETVTTPTVGVVNVDHNFLALGDPNYTSDNEEGSVFNHALNSLPTDARHPVQKRMTYKNVFDLHSLLVFIINKHLMP